MASRLRYNPLLSAPRRLAKKALVPIIYRHRPTGLRGLRLYAYLDAIVQTNKLHGAVVEIGAATCGTAIEGLSTLKQLGSEREYVCIDTFTGYVPEQFDEDIRRGLKMPWRRSLYASNDLALVQSILRVHHANEIRLVQADICTYNDLPETISMCLLDVNLYEPTLAGLDKVWPRLEPGGTILVDDCGDGVDWQARKALAEFCEKMRLPFRREWNNVGFITKQ
jgi:O-methyltransferase